MKFLITGSAGLVGSQVVKDLVKQNHITYSCYHSKKPSCGIPIQLDLSDRCKIVKVLKEIQPERIIHLAAITNVERCETEKELATRINIKSTETIANQAAKQQTFFTYVSTDYVFDGKQGMKKEQDFTNPLGFYGKTKLGGEIALNNIASGWCIARTSTPFGIHNKENFPLWIKKNLESNKKIPVIIDQFTSPTFVPNLSKMLIETTIRQIAGVINLAGATRISRYEFALLIADKLNLDKKLLIPKKIHEMNWKAQRPMDSSLDVSFALEILKEKPLEIEESLELFLSEFQND